MRNLLTLLFISLVCTGGRAQKQPLTDSLHQVLVTTDSDSVRMETYVELIGDRLKKRDTTAARKYLDTLRQLTDAADDAFHSGRYHYMVGQYHLRRQAWEASLAASEKAMDHYRKAGQDNYVFDATWLAGLANMRMNKREEAIRWYQAALSLARKTGNERSLFQALNELGNTHRRSRNLDVAEGYYQEARTVARQMNGLREQLSVLNNLGIIRKVQERFEEARTLYELGLRLAEKMSSPQREIEEAYLYVNLAQMANAQDEPRDALRYAKLAASRFDQYGSPRERAAVLLNLGTTAGKMERYQEAENYYRRAGQVGNATPGIVRASEQGLINVFKKVGPLDSAVHYLEQAALAVKRSAEENREEAIAEMEAKYQNEVKQTEIDRLALEDQLNQNRLRQQRWLIYGGLLVLGLLGAFLYFLLQQRRRIQAQNATIIQSLGEKETLLKEIHHRVKNNLQMVSSLLSLQGEFIEDAAALDAIEMGRQRVRSMAIIHQRLYLRDEVTTNVSARDYLDQLIGELLGTLNVEGKALHLEKQLENIELDIDRLIPLGLIANEVITNAIKYAFVDRNEGKLQVSFLRFGEDIELLIADDGPGQEVNLTGQPDSFGNLLVRTFAEQLNGTLRVTGAEGTRVKLRFPVQKRV